MSLSEIIGPAALEGVREYLPTKVGIGRQNGNLIDGLLVMLEPLNSSRLFDV